MAADVIYLAHSAVVDNKVNSLAVILDIKPVTYILACAVNGQRLVSQSVCDHQRDKLLGEVIGTVVVGAA